MYGPYRETWYAVCTDTHTPWNVFISGKVEHILTACYCLARIKSSLNF